MNPANPELPEIPVALDNALHAEMLDAVGYLLTFAAVDAAWRAILRAGYTFDQSADLPAFRFGFRGSRTGGGVAPGRAQHGGTIMPDSPNPGQSYESWIESKAGASPPDDEVETGFTVYDVPVNPGDPNCSTFRGRRVMRSDADSPSLGEGERGFIEYLIDGWPLSRPVWPPEDEALAEPRDD